MISIDAYESREKMLEHRTQILEAEFSRLTGEPTYTVNQMRDHLKEKYCKREDSENRYCFFLIKTF